MKTVNSLLIAFFFSTQVFCNTLTDTLQLPFEEDFSSGSFQTNGWTLEGTNWNIIGQSGNPSPSVEFKYTPIGYNYSLSLTSPELDGTQFEAGKIFMDFDLGLDDITANNQEKISAEVYDGIQWIEVYRDSSHGDFGWSKKHIDITNQIKGKIFQIRFRAWGVNTLNIYSWKLDNIKIYRLCNAPIITNTYLPDVVNHGCWVLVDWESPCGMSAPAGWLEWDDTENDHGITIPNTDIFFIAAARYTQEQLTEYAGGYLTKIRLFPTTSGGHIDLLVMKGTNANELVVLQPVDSYTPNQWNEFTLDYPVEVSGATELWFGYSIVDYGFPIAGVDAGPANSGYGDMFSLDGVTWASMSQEYGINNNWNLGAFIDTTSISDTCTVQEYNVFRLGEWIASTNDTEYLDKLEEYSRNEISYQVTAVYNDCESAFSNTTYIYLPYCIVSVDNIELDSIEIYPNPASHNVVFNFTDGIQQVIIYDATGNELEAISLNSQQHFLDKDMSQYRNGLYLIKFIYSNGSVTNRKLIISQ
jgi:hypothetical protein